MIVKYQVCKIDVKYQVCTSAFCIWETSKIYTKLHTNGKYLQ